MVRADEQRLPRYCSATQRNGVGVSELRNLLAEVGQTLLYWGFLENELKKPSVAEVLKGCDGGATPCALKTEFAALYRVRNLLAHGLRGAYADLSATNDPWVVCHDSDDSEVKITLSELVNTSARLDRLRLTAKGFY